MKMEGFGMMKRSTLIFILLGINWSLSAQLFQEISLQSKLTEASNNNGVAVADYDNDNDLDVFVVTRWDGQGTATSQLFRNENNGTFTNVTLASGITSSHDYTDNPVDPPHPVGNKMGASWGDYNNDGYPDLFLTNALYIELYRNNTDGTFSNVTAAMGLPIETECVYDVGLWFDYNNDSYLDLYVSGVFECAGKLYRNNAGASFTEVGSAMGLEASGLSAWSALPIDINGDGYLDVYVANDFGATNNLLINNSGLSFEDQAAAYGVTDTYRDGMGTAYADFDQDGLYDIFVTNINESSLFQRTASDSFINVATDLGVERTGWAWGCQFEDFDHDLDVDLVLVNGYYDADYDRYYENTLETGRVGFTDVSEASGIGLKTISNGLATFDYDNDGDLDVLIGRTGDHLGFFENQTITYGGEPEKNWVQLDLIGTTSNRDAIGTKVELSVGGKTLTRYYHGASFLAQNQVPVHFGLSDYEEIDLVTIHWPSGLTDTYDDVPVNAFVRVTESVGYEVLSLSSNKILGCTDPNSCNYDPNATFNDGSCEYLESKSINGSSTSGVLKVETYSYPFTTGNAYEWTVTNGHLLEGQGTSSIKVQWAIGQSGTVTVIEKGTCYSEPVTLDVELSTEQIPENVSVARLWNEALLSAIRVDYARPTVHARNLFHLSIAMYDAWAILNGGADRYLIGKQLHNYNNEFDGFESLIGKDESEQMAISYAAYRLLSHRFKDSPNYEITQQRFDDLMDLLGYATNHTFSDYRGGDPAALGNFIAQSLIDYGMIDGANESGKYENLYYEPANEPLAPVFPGNPLITDPNRWQPLEFEVFIDQAGNPTTGSTPDFLSPEWGSVHAFSLREEDASHYVRDGHEYVVYHDPGIPPYLNSSTMEGSDMDIYKWNFSMVSIWSSHLDPTDGVLWDISPNGIGNINLQELPADLKDYGSFYDFLNGGDISHGRTTNPVTGEAYVPQLVPRGDYTRVLAEFWADGPDSETPPGHWFVLLNYVHDHPEFTRKYKGEGNILDPMEWDVKAYFTLGGAMHDAAIAAWGIKGWYDYIRPISAIRYMADQGQCTNTSLDNYSANGIPLVEGYIEVVEEGDPLAGASGEHVGKIKLYAWRGHDYVDDPSVDQAGVGWILAENWWPYQRPSFVTPPFAGYVSGHSTYSRAAAEVLTRLTGSAYFPGGMGEFLAARNEFLVFEEGPSEDVKLQWATYRDASDQCSLSRIWGGIHPPADDLAGRMIGARIGADAFDLAERYFSGRSNEISKKYVAYPTPAETSEILIVNTTEDQYFEVYDINGVNVPLQKTGFNPITGITTIRVKQNTKGLCFLHTNGQTIKLFFK